MTSPFTPPVALSIAGSDSSGGAGIQADLRTFAALGVFGTTAITAVTAQNTTSVREVSVLSPEMVTSQVEAVLDDLSVAAVKTGMLAEKSIVVAVAELAAAGRLPNLVVDPVMVASSGAVLCSKGAIGAYRYLLSHAAVVTPNLPEANLLAGRDERAGDQEWLAHFLGELFGTVVVVKGGHSTGERSVDVVWHFGELLRYSRPRIATSNSHGSGCTLSAAIAAYLAKGYGVLEAIEKAGDFVHAGVVGGAEWQLGHGSGPLDHFGWSTR